MLIIVEGCDLAGKSTFVEQLAETITDTYRMVPEVLHRGPPTGTMLEEYEKPLRDYVPGQYHIICDRWHIGELIYGPILRGESKLDAITESYINLFLWSRGALVVFLSPGIDVILDRFEARGDDLVKFNQLRTVHFRYKRYMCKPHYGLSIVENPTVHEAIEKALYLEKEASTR